MVTMLKAPMKFGALLPRGPIARHDEPQEMRGDDFHGCVNEIEKQLTSLCGLDGDHAAKMEG